MIVVRGGGPGGGRRRDGGPPAPQAAHLVGDPASRRARRARWRDLPRLIGDSLQAGVGSGEARVPDHVLAPAARGDRHRRSAVHQQGRARRGVRGRRDRRLRGASLPELAALVGITVALDFARAIQVEQTRVLSELVGRQALSRVIDVSTRVDLLAFESPDFYDRLQRARAQGMFRSMQTVNGLLGPRRVARRGRGNRRSRWRPSSRCCCRSCCSVTCRSGSSRR